MHQKNNSKMILHAGGTQVPYEMVRQAELPPPDGAWYPIAHATLVDEVRGHLESSGFRVLREQHALSHNDRRYFGLLDMVPAVEDKERPYCWSMGIRNSNDKAFSASVVAGTRVFVCDNLAFSAEIMFNRRHTLNIGRDLPQLTNRVICKVSEQFGLADKRFDAYRAAELTDRDAHHVLVMALDSGVLPAARVPSVLSQWRKPAHEEFAPRNAWSLFNAFTEDQKSLKDVRKLVTRGQSLHGLFDSMFMLNRPVLDAELVPEDSDLVGELDFKV